MLVRGACFAVYFASVVVASTLMRVVSVSLRSTTSGRRSAAEWTIIDGEKSSRRRFVDVSSRRSTFRSCEEHFRGAERFRERLPSP